MRRISDEAKRKEQIAYIHGRIDQQIETWAERFNWNPMELGAYLGAVLIGAPLDHLSGSELSEPKIRKGSSTLEEVEVASRTHVGRALGKRRRGRPSKDSQDKVKKNPLRGKKQAWWYKLSKEQKDAIIEKRKAKTKKVKEEKSVA